MTHFEFVTVFISIIIAFGVSDILSNWGEQVRLRHKIRHYPLHLAWSVLILIAMMTVWFTLWVTRERPEWTFIEYILMMIPYLVLALIAYVQTPKFDEDERDVKRYYFDHAPWIFSLAALYLLAWMVISFVVLDHPLAEPGSIVRLAGMALMVALAIWKNERFHTAAVVLAYALLAAWIARAVYAL